MFVFKSNNKLYMSPEAYIQDQPDQLAHYGSQLQVYPVFCHRSSDPTGLTTLTGFQTIELRFVDECLFGTVDEAIWVTIGTDSPWSYQDPSVRICPDTVIDFEDFGPDHPEYFNSDESLNYYFTKVFSVNRRIRTVIDENYQ